jgi:site-specific DNA-adenine methylase
MPHYLYHVCYLILIALTCRTETTGFSKEGSYNDKFWDQKMQHRKEDKNSVQASFI